jgi:hypothetical protein
MVFLVQVGSDWFAEYSLIGRQHITTCKKTVKTGFVGFDMLILKLLYFSLKVAEISLSESGYLVPRWLTPHTN